MNDAEVALLVSTLQGQIENLVDAFKINQDRVHDAYKAISTVQDVVIVMNQEVESLRRQVSSLEERVAKLEGRLTYTPNKS